MRILVVEDEKQISDFLKSGLEAESFAVDVAGDGEQGSYLARTNKYDLLILDNILPRKQGKEICIEVRRVGVHTPILILSVQSDPMQKIDLLNAGADDYLIKPFALGELVARIRALQRRPRSIAMNTTGIDNLTLDTTLHRVTRGEKSIRLTKKEFTLLEYMLRNQEVALSRAMLMEHVWDMSIDPFSNTIDSHILSLRKKVDLPGERKLIHTVLGIGYKLGLHE